MKLLTELLIVRNWSTRDKLSWLRGKLALTLSRLAGYKPYCGLPGLHPKQPIWAKTRQQAERESQMLLLGQSTTRLLPGWIRSVRGW